VPSQVGAVEWISCGNSFSWWQTNSNVVERMRLIKSNAFPLMKKRMTGYVSHGKIICR
jgi:hypothetical protein